MFNDRNDDSSVFTSISAGIFSKHLVRFSKPPILTLQKLIFLSFKFTLKVLGIDRFIFKRSALLSDGRKKK